MTGTCNLQGQNHRCGRAASQWVEVEMPHVGMFGFTQRYRAFVCGDHIASLHEQGAHIAYPQAIPAVA